MYNSPYQRYDLEGFFSIFIGWLFILLVVSLVVQKLFSSMLSGYLILLLLSFAFGIRSKKWSPKPMSRSLPLMFSFWLYQDLNAFSPNWLAIQFTNKFLTASWLYIVTFYVFSSCFLYFTFVPAEHLMYYPE